MLGVKKINTYHPLTDGLVERFNRTLTSMLVKRVDRSGADWDSHLPYILFAYSLVPMPSPRAVDLLPQKLSVSLNFWSKGSTAREEGLGTRLVCIQSQYSGINHGVSLLCTPRQGPEDSFSIGVGLTSEKG